MSLIRWSPFFAQDPFEDFDKLLATSNFLPAADIYQTEDAVMVEMPLAGIDPQKVDISIEDDMLIVKGEMHQKSEVEDQDYFRREIRRGSFHRSFPLPVSVIGEEAHAASENGLLKISIPKAGEKTKKKISIDVK